MLLLASLSTSLLLPSPLRPSAPARSRAIAASEASEIFSSPGWAALNKELDQLPVFACANEEGEVLFPPLTKMHVEAPGAKCCVWDVKAMSKAGHPDAVYVRQLEPVEPLPDVDPLDVTNIDAHHNRHLNTHHLAHSNAHHDRDDLPQHQPHDECHHVADNEPDHVPDDNKDDQPDH